MSNACNVVIDAPAYDPTHELALARAVVRTRRAYWTVLLHPAYLDAAHGLIAEHGRDDEVVRLAQTKAELATLASAIDKVGDEHAAADAILRLAARIDDEWHAHARNARAGYLAARDRFVRANLRLVMLFARRAGNDRVPLSDRVQEGNLGLLKAVDRFDPERGVRFSTYAAWWIRHQIFRALANTAESVRVPVQLQVLYGKAQRAQWRALAELGRELDHRELARAIDCDPERLAVALRSAGRRGVSIDAGVDDERPADMTLCDERSLCELEAVASQQDQARALALLAELPERERAVVQERLALPDSFEEIGRRHGISRERARQVQRVALARMRSRLEPRPKLAPYVPA